MNRPVLVVAALLLIGALAWLTHSMNKSVTPDDDDAPPPAASKTTPPAPAAKPVPESPEAAAADLPPELILGDPKAKHLARIGWTYDAQTQADAKPLLAAIGALRGMPGESGGQIAIVVANLDVPIEDRSTLAQSVTEPGITVDGRPVASGELGQGNLAAGNLAQILRTAAMTPGGPPTVAP